MKKLRRIALGFLIAPLLPSLLLEIARRLGAVRGVGGDFPVYCYILTICFGPFGFFFFEAMGWRRLWQYVTTAFVVAFLVAVVLLAEATSLNEFAAEVLQTAGFDAFVGLMAGAEAGLFWAIVFGTGSDVPARSGPDDKAA